MASPPEQQPPRPRNRRRRIPWHQDPKIMGPLIVTTIVAVLLGLLAIPRIQHLLGLDYPTPTLTPGLTSHPTPTLTPTPTPTPCTGQPTKGSVPFAVYPNYDPSGYVGDTGDITVARDPSLVRFTYVTKGQGPYQWDWTYINGKPNPNPSKFGGVLYLHPPDNWGTDSHCGFDLRGRQTLTWKAHSLSGSVYAEFVIGGIDWNWDKDTHEKVKVPYPDSMPRTSLGIKKLTPTWETFTYDLSALPPDDLRAVAAGFGWVISWDSNAVQTGQPQTFVFEIQDIFYQ